MSTSPDKPVSQPETTEAVKNTSISDCLEFFYNCQKRAELASDKDQVLIELCNRRAAANVAEVIFGFLGLANAQTATGKISVSDGSC